MPLNLQSAIQLCVMFQLEVIPANSPQMTFITCARVPVSATVLLTHVRRSFLKDMNAPTPNNAQLNRSPRLQTVGGSLPKTTLVNFLKFLDGPVLIAHLGVIVGAICATLLLRCAKELLKERTVISPKNVIVIFFATEECAQSFLLGIPHAAVQMNVECPGMDGHALEVVV